MGHIVAAALVVSTLHIPPASHGDPSSMSDDERRQVSMALYQEGEALQDASPAEALAKYEEAYHRYTPELHVFNYNIGMAARDAGQCEVARQAFQRFLVMVDEHDNREHARTQLERIEAGECESTESTEGTVPAVGASVPPAETGAAAGSSGGSSGPTAADLEHPDLLSKQKQREAKIGEEIEQRDRNKASGMLIGGAVATTIGGLALIGGAVSLGLANKRANDLADLASPGPTGFPNGNYSDDEVFNLDRNQLPANNAATIGLFVGGSVATVVGATLIGLDFRNRKQARGSEERVPKAESERAHRPRARLVGVSAGPRRGGALASATVAF